MEGIPGRHGGRESGGGDGGEIHDGSMASPQTRKDHLHDAVGGGESCGEMDPGPGLQPRKSTTTFKSHTAGKRERQKILEQYSD